MLSTIFESSPVGHILRHIIQGGGTTLISLGSRINPQIKEELHMLKINILQDFLRHIKVMDTQLSQRHHLIRPPLKPQRHQYRLEDTMKDFMKMTGQSINDMWHSTMVNTQAISKLEMQMGQLANHLGERDKGKLPSQPVNNPKACSIENSSNQEHVQAIVTLRSRKRVDNQVVDPEADHAEEEEPKGEEDDNQKEGDTEPSIVTLVVEEPLRAFVPKAPYLERLQAPKKGGKLEDILEMFKQVQINISVLDAIQQIPSYAKFLKDMVTVKRKTNVPKKAFMTEQVSAILQCKLPLKYKDPRCPTITCMIGVSQIERALLDLAASVNLLPYSIYL
jgi:hypothetical protein